MLLQAHYRTQLNFTFQGLDGVAAALERLNSFIQRIKAIQEGESGGHVMPILNKTLVLFQEALADDLNISPALAALFDMVREINALCDDKKVGKGEAEEILNFLHKIDAVLGVLPLHQEEEKIPLELLEALERREKARQEKQWKIADENRDFIFAQGYLIEDTPAGPRLKKGKKT